MSQNGTNDRDAYIKAWAHTMVNIWTEKILSYGAYDTGDLYESVRLLPMTGEKDFKAIEHIFNRYGIYVDQGSGKEMKKGNSGDLGFTPEREPKPWFSGRYYYYVKKLAEKLAVINGRDFLYIMKKVIEGTE